MITHRNLAYANNSTQIACVTTEQHITASINVARIFQSGESVVDNLTQRITTLFLLLISSS